MATAKKTTKHTTVKRAPAKTTSTTKVTRKSAPQYAEMKSFHRAKNPDPFFTFKITKQTLYWGILCAVVLALGLWVMNINDQVQKIYDQIDATNRSVNN
jgi:hypothetical protein